jgi:hypothetical protein
MASPSPDPELRALQKAWAPAWSIWRARRTLDPPGIHDGDFIASRMDDEAGPYRTVMCSTADELDAALREQREPAKRGMSPLDVAFQW